MKQRTRAHPGARAQASRPVDTGLQSLPSPPTAAVLQSMSRTASGRPSPAPPAARRRTVEGLVSAHPKGFGFLRADPPLPSGDLFLPPGQMQEVLHGDRVRARVSISPYDGRTSGVVLSIVKRRPSRIVGSLRVTGRYLSIVPGDARLPEMLVVEHPDGSHEGCAAIAEIVAWPGPESAPTARIVSVLGPCITPAMAIDIALAANAVPTEWPAAALAEAGALASATSQGLPTREDLRSLPLITIDGADSRDFDDALAVMREGTGFDLTVAIADVSHFVKPGTALDREASRRGTSVYFPGQAVHMLPEALACGLCSLQPDVDRMAMVCRMHVDAAGAISKVRLFRAIIRSHARLTYDQAFAAMQGDPSVQATVSQQTLATLETLRRLYRVLADARARRGAMAFDTAVPSVSLTATGEVMLTPPQPLSEAHGWIEECMIAANVAVARFLAQAGVSAPLRIHARPTEVRYAELLDFLSGHNLSLPSLEAVTPADFSQLIRDTAGHPAQDSIRMALQRAQSAACYGTAHAGHFGLALDDYAHFTSPIRRYPDLLVHRAIGCVLDGLPPATTDSMEALSQACSLNERRAVAAEREVVDHYRCAWLARHATTTHAARVTGIKSFGLFVELESSGVSGLVHSRTLDEGCALDEGTQTLHRAGSLPLRLGDRVQVRVMSVDPPARKVDLAFA